MARRKVLGGFSLLVAALAGAALAPQAKADDAACGTLSAELRQDPTNSSVFTVLGAKSTYRFQERPYVRLPTGVKLALRAPEGVNEADLHRAALCSAASGNGESPLTVAGSELRVLRNGDHYELHITAKDPAKAREIQRRAERLR